MCRVRKLFPPLNARAEVTKLTDKRIRFLCRHIVDVGDWTVGDIAIQYGVTERRVRQLVKQYKDTGEVPRLDSSRRPRSPPLTPEEKRAIDEAWEEKRFGARLLYKELGRRGYRIPHHKIHKYLRDNGRTIPNKRKQKKRKRCRYERKHSFSLVHGDWHRTTKDSPYAIVWLDDASRLALAGAEFPERSGEHSIETFQEAEVTASGYCARIREVNTDRGSEFYSNHPESVSEFQIYLSSTGARHVPSRKANPQTNGKLERFWYEYDRHRWRYPGIAEFIEWYNARLHGALWTDIGECPGEAVYRKLQPESLLGLFTRWPDE
jgi:putative transposase